MQTSSIEAILSLGSIAGIPLDASRCAWQQPIDSRGRPRGKVRWGRWQLVTSRLTLAQYEELQALAASSTAVVDAHVTFLRADGQGTLSTLWGRNCCVRTTVERFDSRGQDGEPSWWVYIELAPEEMGKQAGGAPGPFVMPPPRSYAYTPPVAVLGPTTAPKPEYTSDEFKATIGGADQVSPKIIEQLFSHFNAAKSDPNPGPHWAAMEELIRTTQYTDPKSGSTQTLNGGWPPANGGFNRRTVRPTPPDKFDRYQKYVKLGADGLPELSGTFTSPIPKGGAFDYEARALEGVETDYDLMYEIEILKPLPFTGEEAEIIPWHGHEGNGVQTKMLFPGWDPVINGYPWSWKKLEEEEYIRITYKSSPSGKFEILPNNQVSLKK